VPAANAGAALVIGLDSPAFFDTVPHDLVLKAIRSTYFCDGAAFRV
jgi:hypothetical protein